MSKISCMQVANLYPIHPMKVKIAEGVDAIVVDDPIWKKKKVLKKKVYAI